MKATGQWFRFQNVAADPSVHEIHIIDFIGDWWDDASNRFWGESLGVTARAFVADLSKLPEAVKTIRVHINSPGGDVQGAVNIANALREQQTSKGRLVETIVDGIAASAASIVAMAGSTVRMADNALMMIHNPWTIALGNASEMRKTADVLDTIRGQIVATYQWHSTLDEKAIAKLMDEETWMDADEAIAGGFATEKVEGIKAAASIDPRAMAKLTVPEKYRSRAEALTKAPEPKPQPAAAVEVIRMCKDSDCFELAESLLASNATADEARAQIAAAKQAKVAAAARATEITALCAKVKLPELAEGYIAGAMPLDAVRSHLTTLAARLDPVEIDGGLDPDRGPAAGASSWKNAYAKVRGRNAATRS